jgi:hypothetical protein
VVEIVRKQQLRRSSGRLTQSEPTKNQARFVEGFARRAPLGARRIPDKLPLGQSAWVRLSIDARCGYAVLLRDHSCDFVWSDTLIGIRAQRRRVGSGSLESSTRRQSARRHSERCYANVRLSTEGRARLYQLL